MLVTERYELPRLIKTVLRNKQPNFGFGTLGQIVYARTYSRIMDDGAQEAWADTVIRVVEGVISIRKDWAVKHNLPWNENHWNDIAMRMANAIYDMRFLPPGRGLWAMGTQYTFSRGGMALQNCGYTDITTLSRDSAWAMDALMTGVGIGFGVTNGSFELRHPSTNVRVYQIPDTREGWVESLRQLVAAYETGGDTVEFDYSLIRPAGTPIKGFGGTASGHEPLEVLHKRVRGYLDDRVMGKTTNTRLIVDVLNAIGACVVAGNVRRSAEIALGSPFDDEFLNLKNYGQVIDGQWVDGPAADRQEIGWMSNNSVVLREIDDFKRLPEIAELVRINGEPGLMNLLNIQKYGRYGEEMPDPATGCNPCAEQPLEDKEVCCLVEVFPTRCKTDAEYFEALELAQIYAHTVSLLPTHSAETNAVVARNHRIGQSLSGIADWYEVRGASEIITLQRQGYKLVREMNRRLAQDAGVPESIRVTTVKPSGTISLLAGVSPGMHYPVYSRYLRRVRFGADTPLVPLLQEAGVPHEPDAYSANTLVFEFPVETGAGRGQRDISVWQKAAMVKSLQMHWSDNMVSNTLTFNPKTEGHMIEDLLAFTIPFTKTISLLPDSEDGGAYAQMPYEEITKREYEERASKIRDIDWSQFGGSDGQDSKFCNNDGCEV